LGKAPLFIQAVWRDGMTVQVEGGDGSVHEEDRKLDFLAALEFDRLHAALSKKGAAGSGLSRRDGDEVSPADGAGVSSDDGAGDEGPSDTDESPPGDEQSAADRKVRQGIERALVENWGLREVTRYVDKAISALDAPAAKKGK